MIKNFFSPRKSPFHRAFSTYYRFNESYFNLAFTINGQNLVDKQYADTVLQKINKFYKAGVNHVIIKLKANDDEQSIHRVIQRIKRLADEFPDLKVQGMQYSMALAQPTKHFLTNEFQFALKASKYLKETSKLGSYFLIESEKFFNSVIENKDEKLIEEFFFNLDILGQTQQNLNFTTPVYLLKYYKQKTDRANFEKFQQLNKSKYIGVDLRLNDSFLKPENLQDKKYSHEFLKYCFGFDNNLKVVDLRDFSVKQNEENKQLDIETVPIGQGVFDFNLLFNMLKIINYEGVMIVPDKCDAEGVKKLQELAKKHEYQEKTEEEIKEYMEFKQKQREKEYGIEFAVLWTD